MATGQVKDTRALTRDTEGHAKAQEIAASEAALQ
jgi:hypothetical protein